MSERVSKRAVEVFSATLFGVLFSSGLAPQSTFVRAVCAVDAIIFLHCVLCPLALLFHVGCVCSAVTGNCYLDEHGNLVRYRRNGKIQTQQWPNCKPFFSLVTELAS